MFLTNMPFQVVSSRRFVHADAQISIKDFSIAVFFAQMAVDVCLEACFEPAIELRMCPEIVADCFQ